MTRTASYAPAATPSAEDEVFQRPLDLAPTGAVISLVRVLVALAQSRR